MNELEIRRAAVLARVSSDEQVKGTSLTTQVEECKQKAQEMGYLVTDGDIFIEDGVSGSLPLEQRPKLSAIMDGILDGQYSALVTYSPDRLSRDDLTYLMVDRMATKCGTEIIYTTVSYEATPQGHFLKGVMAQVAQLERKLILQRTMRGRKATHANGHYAGQKLPYGYSWDATLKQWLINPEEAAIINQIFHWYVYSGLSFRKIAGKLNEQGIPLPKKKVAGMWSCSQLNILIRQPAYIGVYYGLKGMGRKVFLSVQDLEEYATTAGWTHIPNFPPILVTSDGSPNVELWEAAQRRCVDNRRRGTGLNRVNPWPLQGRLRCSQCGLLLKCRHNHSGKGSRVYFCNYGTEPYEQERSKCNTPRVRAAEVERAIAQYLSMVINEPETLETAIKGYLSELDSKIAEYRQMAAPIEVDIQEIEARIKRANKLYFEGKMGDTEYGELTDPLFAKLARLGEKRDTPKAAVHQLEQLNNNKKAIEEILANGTLVATVSALRGLKILSAYSEAERLANHHNGAGVEGINSKLYKGEAGDLDFTKLLNLLSLRVTVYPGRIVVEGLIPLEIPMDEISPMPFSQKGPQPSSSATIA